MPIVFRSRCHARIRGVLVATITSFVLVAVPVGTSHAAAATAVTQSVDSTCWITLTNPQRGGFLNPTVGVRGSIECDIVSSYIYLEVTVIHAGNGETTRAVQGNDISGLSGSATRPCVTGWYSSRLHVIQDIGGVHLDEIYASDRNEYIEC
jgi:hypothetical protein